MSQDDPEELFKTLRDKFQQVRFGGGVVNKTTYIAAALLVPIWGGIVFRISSDLTENVALVSIGLIATGFVVWWIKKTHAFAEKNPLQAILSGAQFVEYHRAFSIQSKNLAAPINQTPIPDPLLPMHPSSDPTVKDRPDV